MEVHERPANRFVAGFIGHPPMNFLEGRLTREGEQLCFIRGPLRLPLPREHWPRLCAFVDRELVLGLRPEAWHPGVDTAAQSPSVPARVLSVERVADRRVIHCSVPDGSSIVCCVDSQDVISTGELLYLRPALHRAHFFAADENGGALL